MSSYSHRGKSDDRLRNILEDAALAAGKSLDDLTVLAERKDPYRIATTAGHRNGQWFAEQVTRFVRGRDVHLRGLHYMLVAADDVWRPDNHKPKYANTDDCYEWLCEYGAKAARWLDYVSWDRIKDERNAAPELFIPEGKGQDEVRLHKGLSARFRTKTMRCHGSSVQDSSQSNPSAWCSLARKARWARY